ncbi:MAG: hypothetical protein JWO30_3496 [Fibrobacteres bacterium]|nr:hypothetical protein [Fibrobacterota bacterium]
MAETDFPKLANPRVEAIRVEATRIETSLSRFGSTRSAFPAAVLAALLLTGCSAFDALKQRLGILGVRFSVDRLDVSHLVYPSNLLSASLDLFSRDKSFLGQFGVDVRVDIKAANSHAQRAVFDGANGHLRVLNTSASDPSAIGAIPAFSVGPGADTVVPVTFPLRLDNPVFSKAAWKAIVEGKDIPYKIDAEMKLSLMGANAYGLPQALESRAVTLNVAKGSVNARAAGSNALERFLKLLDAVL